LGGGGGANTGNVTFDDVNIIGTGNLNLQPDSGNSEYLNIYLTGAADIHVAAGSGGGNVILGTDEGANVAVLLDGNVAIQAGNVGGKQTWAFDTAGNLTLPGNTFAVNYANGDPITFSGGNVDTGNVTFSDQIVIGTGISNLVSGLYLAPSSSSANAVQYLRVRGDVTYEPTHIHFDTGNNQYFNQFIGDDNKYVLLSNIGDIVIRTDDNAGNSAQWTFGADGNLTVPGNILGGGNILIAPDSANSGGYLDIYLTTGPDVHIASNGDSNLILGRDDSSNVTVNTDGNVTIQANTSTPHVWKFDSSGVLNVPGEGVIRSTNDTVTLQSFNNITGNANSVYLGTSGGLGFLDQEIGGNWLEIFRSGTEPQIGTTVGNLLIQTSSNATPYNWIFGSTGNVTLPANGAIQTAPGSNGNIYIHPDGNGRVVIQGGASTLLTLASDLPDTQNKFEIDTYGANLGNLGGGVFTGTYLRPGNATQQDDRLAQFGGKGSEDGITIGLPLAAKITLDAAANWSVGNTPSHISFYTTPSAANVSIEQMRLGSAGNLTIFNGGLNVAGNIAPSGVASPAPSINGFASVNAGNLSASGNVTGGNLITAGSGGDITLTGGNILGALRVVTTPTALANLTAVAGGRAFVNNGNLTAAGNFGAQIGSGGSNVVPVWSDGTNWYIG
jgi:hypothetical protein